MSDYLYSVERSLKTAAEDVQRLQAENAELIAARDALKARIDGLIETNNTLADALGIEEIKSANTQARIDSGIRCFYVEDGLASRAYCSHPKRNATLILDEGVTL